MKQDFAKVRSVAGLFLEALTLTFLLFCTHDTTASDTLTKDDSDRKSTMEYVVISSVSSTTFQLLSRSNVADPALLLNTPALQQLCFLSGFGRVAAPVVRNMFFKASEDHIP